MRKRVWSGQGNVDDAHTHHEWVGLTHKLVSADMDYGMTNSPGCNQHANDDQLESDWLIEQAT